jgi:hypothetical protein
MHEDQLYQHRKTIDQNELTIDIKVNGSQNDLWGAIEDNQNTLENRIDITYNQERNKWDSIVHYVLPKIWVHKNVVLATIKTFTWSGTWLKFPVILAKEIMSSSWETTKSKSLLAFTMETRMSMY